eukprot:scaffold15105_cov36-Cyclotella_meneghiniana.AAC.1
MSKKRISSVTEGERPNRVNSISHNVITSGETDNNNNHGRVDSKHQQKCPNLTLTSRRRRDTHEYHHPR